MSLLAQEMNNRYSKYNNTFISKQCFAVSKLFSSSVKPLQKDQQRNHWAPPGSKHFKNTHMFNQKAESLWPNSICLLQRHTSRSPLQKKGGREINKVTQKPLTHKLGFDPDISETQVINPNLLPIWKMSRLTLTYIQEIWALINSNIKKTHWKMIAARIFMTLTQPVYITGYEANPPCKPWQTWQHHLLVQHLFHRRQIP